MAALAALAGLDEERSTLYHDLVLAALAEAARKALEDLMNLGNYEYQSEFARRYFAQGRVAGKTEDLLKILSGRGIAVNEEQRQRILACTDVGMLDRWIDQALKASTADEALAWRRRRAMHEGASSCISEPRDW